MDEPVDIEKSEFFSHVTSTIEAAEEARIAERVAQITGKQAELDAIRKTARPKIDPAVAAARNQRRRRSKMADASRRKNRRK